EQKFYEYARSPLLSLDLPEFKDFSVDPFDQHNEQLYKIILASVQLDVLDQKDWQSDSVFRLHLRHYNIHELLKKLNKEQLGELQGKVWTELQDVEDPQKEAVKIILELRKTL
ncbi:hypothetical protein WAJ05_19460, partial [Acinetobacter baumannii]